MLNSMLKAKKKSRHQMLKVVTLEVQYISKEKPMSLEEEYFDRVFMYMNIRDFCSC